MNSMSTRAGKRDSIRLLGSVRPSAAPGDKKAEVPKLNIPSRGQVSFHSGIQGSAMTLPTPKQTSRSLERRQSAPVWPKSASSTRSVSHELCEKDMREVLDREQELKKKLSELQKQLQNMTAQLKDRDGTIERVTSERDSIEEKYKQLLMEEKAKHLATQQMLESAQNDAKDTLARLQVLERETQEKMEQLRLDLTRQMTEMMTAKDRELADKDKQLEKLKEQLAEALKGSSWDRQQRMEELGKEVLILREESRSLRNELKTLAKGKPGHCDNCAQLTARAEKLAVTLKEKDVVIKDLKSLCTKFETQLSQQDYLLKQWADSKDLKTRLEDIYNKV